jgi:hypothetical protein
MEDDDETTPHPPAGAGRTIMRVPCIHSRDVSARTDTDVGLAMDALDAAMGSLVFTRDSLVEALADVEERMMHLSEKRRLLAGRA